MKKGKTFKIGIVLLIAVFGFFIVRALSPTPRTPRDAFERLIVKPMPSSVSSLKVGGFLGMNDAFQIFCLQIGKPDLQLIVDSRHFVPVDEQNEFEAWDTTLDRHRQVQKSEYLRGWEQKIKDVVKLDWHLTDSCQIYLLKEKNCETRLFAETNSSAAVFVFEMH